MGHKNDNPDIRFVSVQADGTPEEGSTFIDEFGLDTWSAPANDEVAATLVDELEIDSVPMFVFINDDGTVETQSGWTESDFLESMNGLRG